MLDLQLRVGKFCATLGLKLPISNNHSAFFFFLFLFVCLFFFFVGKIIYWVGNFGQWIGLIYWVGKVGGK